MPNAHLTITGSSNTRATHLTVCEDDHMAPVGDSPDLALNRLDDITLTGSRTKDVVDCDIRVVGRLGYRRLRPTRRGGVDGE